MRYTRLLDNIGVLFYQQSLFSTLDPDIQLFIHDFIVQICLSIVQKSVLLLVKNTLTKSVLFGALSYIMDGQLREYCYSTEAKVISDALVRRIITDFLEQSSSHIILDDAYIHLVANIMEYIIVEVLEMAYMEYTIRMSKDGERNLLLVDCKRAIVNDREYGAMINHCGIIIYPHDLSLPKAPIERMVRHLTNCKVAKKALNLAQVYVEHELYQLLLAAEKNCVRYNRNKITARDLQLN